MPYNNPRFDTFTEKLRAAGVTMRCMWQSRRDGKTITDKRHHDVECVAFVGNGFQPSELTAIVVDYGERDGFGLWLDAPGDFDELAARIAKPRETKEEVTEAFVKLCEELAIPATAAAYLEARRLKESANASLALLREAVEAWPQTEIPAEMRLPGCIPEEEEGEEINGGDMVEWWGGFYGKAKAIVEGRS